MFLCPAFFQLPVFPLTSQCPVLTGPTTLSGTYLIDTQYTSLLHELVRVYLGTYLIPEVDTVNEAMALDTEQAAINTGSYAWYAACKFSSFSPFLSFFLHFL